MADKDKWPIIPGAPSYGQGRDKPGPRFTSLIHGEHLSNVTIRGDGAASVLDGQGDYWWPQKKSLPYTRGHLIELMYTTDLVIRDFAMKDSPFWNNHIYDCERVYITGMTITAPDSSPNTDGWDPDSSRDVLIENSYYQGGDDCVAIKSGWDCFGVAYDKPCSNITIRNLTCDGRFAGIAVGSEMSGGVDNVLVENVRFKRANGAAHIKTGPTRGGYVVNVTFADLIAEEGAVFQDGVLVDAFYKAPNPSCPPGWKPPTLAKMQGYHFRRIDGTKAAITGSAFHLKGQAASPIEGVTIEDVHFSAGEWDCSNVSGTAASGTVTPWPPCPQITSTAAAEAEATPGID